MNQHWLELSTKIVATSDNNEDEDKGKDDEKIIKRIITRQEPTPLGISTTDVRSIAAGNNFNDVNFNNNNDNNTKTVTSESITSTTSINSTTNPKNKTIEIGVVHGRRNDIEHIHNMPTIIDTPKYTMEYNAINNDKDNDTNNSNGFCRTEDMYMTMFMDGFHVSLLGVPTSTSTSTIGSNATSTKTTVNDPDGGDGDGGDGVVAVNACLNYLVQSWRLDDPGKFKGAMVFAFLLAVLVEGLSAVRGIIVINFSRTVSQKHTRHILLTACYGVQGLLGYILMLITMSYSVELVASVIFGLMVGNALFMKYDPYDSIVVSSNNTTTSSISSNNNNSNDSNRATEQTIIRQRRTRRRNSGTCTSIGIDTASRSENGTTGSTGSNNTPGTINNNSPIATTDATATTVATIIHGETRSGPILLHRRRKNGSACGWSSSTTIVPIAQHQLITPRTPLTMLQTNQSVQGSSAANSDNEDYGNDNDDDDNGNDEYDTDYDNNDNVSNNNNIDNDYNNVNKSKNDKNSNNHQSTNDYRQQEYQPLLFTCK